ncbi:nicotinate-nucleotide--dimethylbenzimidazole phosphoribosyltransferase [Myroides indicus]|uniref:Nicotinate-nucleotide--dimethylbenzimidazole phosphoribosyltransferase n=1 Tax=Myroides indicus TaxID=1323422 RepID=A0A4R7EP21_9FLAO|nr:nicotinate-nucleotide--dimethylbenzimidazole phosphoribosyltransferase [Myroides indicus]TDS53827.1 nicotinate-nucleotide-dimethylbenzimidazole phosphoribosyltransferase [Myroides indicus]
MNFDQQLQNKIDLKTKPLKALGQLEEIAFKIGKIQKTLSPELISPSLIIFAADHGLAQEGISAYPTEVTQQMVLNFLQGGAAINVFCQQNNINLKIVDAGVNADFEKNSNLIHAKAGYGTQNMLNANAMTAEQLSFCFQKGEDIVDKLTKSKCNIVGFGEMGIGNTSSASLLMSSLLDIPIEECVGRGTGIDDIQLYNKKVILKRVMENRGCPNSVEEALLFFGGFEIAQMYSSMLEAYRKNMVIMIDGFIASSAFLAAYKIDPKILDNALFCHQSDEKGHQLLLKKLNEKAILKLNLRLGEGTGCAIAYPIIKSAVEFLNKMASFESAKISNK